MAIVVTVFLLVSAAVGIVVLYLVKSALGIDLIPGFSFGVWGWWHRDPSVADVAIDLAGTALGLGLAWAATRLNLLRF
jgi:hypothetical protein